MAARRGGLVRTSLRILVAVTSEGLTRVIFHLLANVKDVDVVCSVTDASRLVHYAERVLPHLIIADSCSVNSIQAINELKTASPGVKLILTHWTDAPHNIDRLRGEDARINEDFLVDQLVPTVLKLSTQDNAGPRRIAKRSYQ
jgi:DNA-binding NarL/FixJ family response regulator